MCHELFIYKWQHRSTREKSGILTTIKAMARILRSEVKACGMYSLGTVMGGHLACVIANKAMNGEIPLKGIL